MNKNLIEKRRTCSLLGKFPTCCVQTDNTGKTKQTKTVFLTTTTTTTTVCRELLDLSADTGVNYRIILQTGTLGPLSDSESIYTLC